MIAVILICVPVLFAGVVLMYLVPPLFAVGLALAAISAVVLLQALLLALVRLAVKDDGKNLVPVGPKYDVSEFSGILWAYRDLKVFLARVAGFVGFAYGLATQSIYFTVLGAAAILLFWILDRLQLRNTEAPAAGSDVPHTGREACKSIDQQP